MGLWTGLDSKQNKIKLEYIYNIQNWNKCTFGKLREEQNWDVCYSFSESIWSGRWKIKIVVFIFNLNHESFVRFEREKVRETSQSDVVLVLSDVRVFLSSHVVLEGGPKVARPGRLGLVEVAETGPIGQLAQKRATLFESVCDV